MDSNFFIGEQSLSSGGLRSLRAGQHGQQMVGNIFPDFFELLLRGRVYAYHVASQALLLAATTGGHPTIVNPVGSGVVWLPIALRLGFISGTTTISGLVWRQTLNVGGGAATGAAILTATLVAPVNALLGGGGVTPKCLWSPTTNTFTAAPAAFMSTGINLGAADPSVGGDLGRMYYGEWGVAPGAAVSLCATVTTTTSLFQITIIGAEVPLPV